MSIYKFNSVFHQVDISLLRHFFAISTFGGFLKDSIASGVSQPALSLGLQKLEKSLGVTLIDRSTRPFQLTQAGRTLLTFCQRFEGSFEAVVESLGSTAVSVHRKIKVGSALSVGISPVEALYDKIEREKESFELDFVCQNTYQLLDDVFEGRLDGAFVPDDVYDNRFSFTSISKDQITFVIGKKVRNSFVGKDWHAAISDIPLITFPRETPMRTLTDKICISEQLAFKSIYSVNSIDALRFLVEKNKGGAFVARSAVQSELKSKVIYEETPPLRLPKLGVSFVTRLDGHTNVNAKMILKLYKNG